MTVVIGTAGHIDHGKTTLLRALTGIDADRLPEERRRGMTIDVGYAHLDLPDGSSLDFVDVPGHDRLVGNMLVGAGEIDAALLVVAADDGPRAQTLEHLELLDALGIRHGVVAVTKADLAGPERTVEVVAAVAGLLAGTTLDRSPIVAVASPAGTGVDDLRAALLDLRDRVVADRPPGSPAGATTTRRSPIPRGPRLAVDRAFTVKGRGLVVTGSLRGGPLGRGRDLRLEPGGRTTVRVREIQVHGRPVDLAPDGGRVALNIGGAGLDEVRRGHVLVDDPGVRATDRLLVVLRPPSRPGARFVGTPPGEIRWPPTAGITYRLHLGTDAVDATIRRGLRDGVTLADGRRIATLGLVRPVAAAVGDPFLLRVPSPAATAAGGTILDTAPPTGPSRRRVSGERLAALAAARESGDRGAELAALVGLHGWVATIAAPADVVVPPGVRSFADGCLDASLAGNLADAAIVAVDAQHDREPLAAGMALAELRPRLVSALRRDVTIDRSSAQAIAGSIVDALVTAGRLARTGDLVRDPTRATGALPPAVVAAMDRLEGLLAVPAPPSLAEAMRRAGCPAEGLRSLEATGRVVRVEPDLAWAGSTYRELESLALRLADGGPLTPAAMRDATGTSRKYVMVLLEDLDRRGILRRTADGHVRGPRAPR